MPRTRRLACCAIAVATLCAVPEAQTPQTPGTGLIVGRVVDAKDAPLNGVQVSLTPGGVAGGISPVGVEPQRVLVDAMGGFVFSSLRAGTYTLVATKPGYADGMFGRRRPGGSGTTLYVVEGQPILDLSIRLWKFATIAGTITDEAGDPVVGINVRVLRRAWVAGRPRAVAAASVTTDDRGVYRVASLIPGNYIVAVPSTQTTVPASFAETSILFGEGQMLPRSAFDINMMGAPPGPPTDSRPGEFVLQPASQAAMLPEPDASDRQAVYPTVFYPNAAASVQATVITLGSGDERAGADVRLRAVGALRVSGTLAGPDGPVRLQRLRLIAQTADDLATEAGFETAIALSDNRGAFTFLGVPPGQYVLRVLKAPAPPQIQHDHPTEQAPAAAGRVTATPSVVEPTLWAAEPVVVGDRDVTVSVALSPGSRVSGRFEFQGAAPRPAADRLAQIPVVLEAVDARVTGAPPPGRGDASGGFATNGVPAGRYFLRVGGAPAGWTFKSAMLDGKDLSETSFELRASDLSGILITFTDQPTQLSGTVANSDRSPDTRASVMVFPADPGGWVDYGSNPRRLRIARVSGTGAYSFANLPPGAYLVAAVTDDVAGEWPSPKFLDTLSRLATRITIADGQRLSQDLRTVVVR